MTSPWAKYAYTIILCLNHMAYACCATAIGSILTEMVDILQTTTDKMTLFTTFTSTGFLVGSFFCFLLKYLNRQWVWILYEIVMALCLTFIPHSQNLIILYCLAVGIGVGFGVLNTIINVWIIEMWKEKSPPILQIPGLTFGVGTILSPLIIKPFLRHKNDMTLTTESHLSTNSMLALVASTNSTQWSFDREYEEWRRHLLKSPFYILGSIQLIFPILMIIMYGLTPYKYSVKDFQSNDSNISKKKENKLFDRQRNQRKLMLLLMSMLVGTFNIFEATYYTFGSTYFQYSPLHLTETESADMITSFTIPYTIFRGISCLIAIKVLPKYILGTHYVINIIGMVCLVMARNSKTMLWVSNVIIGIGISAVMQTTFAFVGQHFLMTDIIGAILIVFLGSFNIAPPYILGLFINDHSFVFIIVEGIALFICITLFIILLFFIRKYERIDKS